ncbi:hypothetical protein [Sphingosinicella microcystinivorans]|uniref:hypothetical protein n=1 Tax=Sphingosinicella microcystinivorans TaxID=335406 RepID=UPI0022F3DEF7|nr:hypothetical protein [Sphingosinicella microcystinivorans]WBX85120.1 hypothetical protein PE061_04120 [Sphingosinicella microcystinivorans]
MPVKAGISLMTLATFVVPRWSMSSAPSACTGVGASKLPLMRVPVIVIISDSAAASACAALSAAVCARAGTATAHNATPAKLLNLDVNII